MFDLDVEHEFQHSFVQFYLFMWIKIKQIISTEWKYNSKNYYYEHFFDSIVISMREGEIEKNEATSKEIFK